MLDIPVGNFYSAMQIEVVQEILVRILRRARVAELADALDLGSSG